MVNALTLYYIIFSWLTVIVNIVLASALLRNFIRKKTLGTIILFVSYMLIGFSAILAAIHYSVASFNISIEFIGVSQTLATLFPLIALLQIYVFSCRHILKDNEVLKNFHLIIFSIIIGSVFTIYLMAVFGITPQQPGFLFAEDVSPLWYQMSRSDVANTSLFNLTVRASVMVITTIQIYINLRIIIRAFILSRRTDRIIRKRGLQLIATGLLVYLTAGIVIALEMAISWPEGSAMPTILWTLRKVIFITSYLILYLGWIMPDWFRRRLRGKTWFEMQYKTVSKQS